MCVPAAFTTVDNQIDGLFIENGVVKNSTINKKLNGVCILANDGIKIINFQDWKPDLIDQAKSDKSSVFQQQLLVEKGEIVPCNLFGNHENIRRSLIQFSDFYCIGESHRRTTLKEFQESLKSIGAVNAIHLDMGTWSEGWYKNHLGEKKQIGENMTNTQKQTNWLFYKK